MLCAAISLTESNDIVLDILVTVSRVESLLWRHNGCDSVSNHQHHDCLFNPLIRRRSKKTSKLRVTGLCAGNSPETGEFPAQMASNAENVSIWWRHHVLSACCSKDAQHMRLTHLPLGPHICVTESGQHWFRSWLIAYSTPSHYLNQY